MDGGYVLLLLKHARRVLFHDIDWSTSLVLEQTRRAAEANHLSLVMMEPLEDIDDVTSLGRFRDRISQRDGPALMETCSLGFRKNVE
jgi:glycosyltransferase A (GT-A) superfamily protein (DUF2064 family)